MVDQVTILNGEVREASSEADRYVSEAPLPAGYVNVPGAGPMPMDVADRLVASGDIFKDEGTGQYSLQMRAAPKTSRKAPSEAPQESLGQPEEQPGALSKGEGGKAVLNLHDAFGSDVSLLADAMGGGMQDIAVEAVADAAKVSKEEAQHAVAEAEMDVRLEVNGVLFSMGIPEADFDAVAQFASRNVGMSVEIARAAMSGGNLEDAARALGRAYLASRR